jgi:hypothetical protein
MGRLSETDPTGYAFIESREYNRDVQRRQPRETTISRASFASARRAPLRADTAVMAIMLIGTKASVAPIAG